MHGHGEKPYMCTYEGCDRSISGHGFPRQWNLRDHMRRVHNDNGAIAQPASPPPSSAPATTTTSTRGRKRKNDTEKPAQEKSSSRKSAAKAAAEAAAPVAKQPEPVVNPEIEQWYEHQRALQTFIQGCVQPDDAQSLQYLKDAQDHLSAMGKISHGLIHGSHRRSWRG